MRNRQESVDMLRSVARARKRGWVQEEYPEGNGIKLTTYREVSLAPGVVSDPSQGSTFIERRSIYVVFFENRPVAYRLREDLSPTMKAPRSVRISATRLVEYLEEHGRDPDFMADHGDASIPRNP